MFWSCQSVVLWIGSEYGVSDSLETIGVADVLMSNPFWNWARTVAWTADTNCLCLGEAAAEGATKSGRSEK